VQTPGGFEVPAIDAKANSAAIHFHIQRDRRDSTFYPTKGTLVDVIGNFFDQAWAVSVNIKPTKWLTTLSHRERENRWSHTGNDLFSKSRRALL
jgi:hypothetical protein